MPTPVCVAGAGSRICGRHQAVAGLLEALCGAVWGFHVPRGQVLVLANLAGGEHEQQARIVLQDVVASSSSSSHCMYNCAPVSSGASLSPCKPGGSSCRHASPTKVGRVQCACNAHWVCQGYAPLSKANGVPVLTPSPHGPVVGVVAGDKRMLSAAGCWSAASGEYPVQHGMFAGAAERQPA